MKRLIAAAAAAAGLWAAQAHATTYTTFVEGPRSGGIDLGELSGSYTDPVIDIDGRVGAAGNATDDGFGAGEGFKLLGRVTNSGSDALTFTFDTAFTVELTSLVSDAGGATDADFGFLLNPAEGGSPLSINVTSGDLPMVLWTLAAGTYALDISATGSSALYDLQVSAVPLPAGLGLVLGAFGLWGAASRRRRAA